MSPKRPRAFRVFEIGVYVLVAAVVAQFFLAGMVVFVDSNWLFAHGIANGSLIFFGSIILIGVGWYAGAGRGAVLLTAAIPVLVFLQSIFIAPYREAVQGPLRTIAALHVLNAVLIFWVALQLMDRVRHRQVSPMRVEVPAAKREEELVRT